jgi:hypothetical protein
MNHDNFYDDGSFDSDLEFKADTRRDKGDRPIKERSLEARRRVERLMELRRLKELDEDIEWEDYL